ncbi:MAG TPA: response regulator transcription factor, partial [Actinomycetota bacterium]|nr:response regulator transcription factor [Actinomycetota bacterium]
RSGERLSPVQGGRRTVPLSPRYVDVLRLMAEGRTNREIALELGLSIYTVKNYVERIYERLGARDRVQAVTIALRAGLI